MDSFSNTRVEVLLVQVSALPQSAWKAASSTRLVKLLSLELRKVKEDITIFRRSVMMISGLPTATVPSIVTTADRLSAHSVVDKASCEVAESAS